MTLSANPDGHRPGRFDVVALLAALAIAVLIVGLHVHRYRSISPIDELQHIDAVEKFPHVIRRGELIGEAAMREESCRGIDANFFPPPCDAPVLHPADYQEQGYNTTYIHPPLYYGATHIVAVVIDKLPGVDGLVTASRLAGALWLMLGLTVLWWVLVARGVPPLGQFAVLTMLASTPVVIHASTTVNPDALALAAGAAVLWALHRWEQGRARSWLLAVTTAICISFKFTHVAGVGLVLAYLVIVAVDRWLTTREFDAELRRHLLQAFWILVAVGVTQLVWSTVQEQLALVPREAIPMVGQNQVDSLPLIRFAQELHTMVTPVRTPYLPPPLRRTSVTYSVQLLDLLGLAAIASAAVYGAARSRIRLFALATALAMIATGPVMAVAFYVSSRLGSDVPSRYGIALLPGIALCAAPALQRRWVQLMAAAFAVFSALAIITSLA